MAGFKILHIILIITVALLTLDAAVEIGIAAATISYFRSRGLISTNYGNIYPRPELYTQEIDAVNLAAGAIAFVLVGLLGLVTLVLRSRKNGSGKAGRIVFYVWLAMTVCSALATLAATVLAWVEWAQRRHDVINPAALRFSYLEPYDRDSWTPETWYYALLTSPALELDEPSQIAELEYQLSLYQGERWNLVPLIVLGWLVMGLAIAEAVVLKHTSRHGPSESKAAQIESQYAHEDAQMQQQYAHAPVQNGESHVTEAKEAAPPYATGAN